MSHSSRSSGSSLLHLRRPARLHENRPQLEIVVNDNMDAETVASVCSSPTSSIHQSTIFLPARTVPSPVKVVHGTCTAKLERPTSLWRASTEGDAASSSCLTATNRSESCVDLLRSVKPGVRVAKPRSEWMPDEASALCNHPFCSTMFGQTTLSLGPRRHHCRLCGLIFCHAHSAGRLPLQTTDAKNQRTVVPLRVCDGCREEAAENDGYLSERRSSDTTPSLVSSAASSSTDENDSWISTRNLGRSQSYNCVTELQPTLAPIEDWMDRSGVLSLYPLAVNASHARRRAASPINNTRAVGPLFAPTLSERRSAKEKELHRLSRRQRRNMGLWVSTPVGSDADSDNEGGSDESGFYGLARERKADPSGTRTPQERELDWSTF